ncbi:CPBP family intramembrane glutamic endopeptidase [Parenemella sanctibonifatiensis]|uniref:CAAX prenyl protease 2/Lysostaphin resistance protein A-like domain-containing protein n=1 Tax=Parenemella sanctibonifatiensis TaxID=2016505 RepID=A0A255EAE6_9ACTN|nr:CPBP family intramembrane glutamic endopeptidase [Parenemella sanctibonifatiensis]OYN85113.1 hypothetical protein CGZ92_11665 [Parenemella sanctibonifatiensis]
MQWPESDDSAQPIAAVPWRRGLVTFLVAVFVGIGLLAMPALTTGGLHSEWFAVTTQWVAVVPAAAAIFTLIYVEKQGIIELDVQLGGNLGKFVLGMLAALLVPPLLTVAGLGLSALVGLYEFDLVNYTGMTEALRVSYEVAGLEPPVVDTREFLGTLGMQVFFSGLLGIWPAIVEEMGWRGYLFPKLRQRYSLIPTIVLTGLAWALSLTPLLVTGWLYPGVNPVVAVLAYCGYAIVVGGLLGWLRSWTRSVWPSALALGTFTASMGLPRLLGSGDQVINPALIGITGVMGWIVPAAVLALLIKYAPWPVQGDADDPRDRFPDPTTPTSIDKQDPNRWGTLGQRGALPKDSRGRGVRDPRD